LFNVT